MQTSKSQRENINARSDWFTQRIGSTVYEVHVHFDTVKTESFEDKILRMMRNDLRTGAKCGIINLPQADKPPERGSV